MYQSGAVELLLSHRRGENHRQVQPGRREDGEGESGGDDAERPLRRPQRPGCGVLQDVGVQEQQRSRVLHTGQEGSHGGPVRGAHRHHQQEPPVYIRDIRRSRGRGTVSQPRFTTAAASSLDAVDVAFVSSLKSIRINEDKCDQTLVSARENYTFHVRRETFPHVRGKIMNYKVLTKNNLL